MDELDIFEEFEVLERDPAFDEYINGLNEMNVMLLESDEVSDYDEIVAAQRAVQIDKRYQGQAIRVTGNAYFAGSTLGPTGRDTLNPEYVATYVDQEMRLESVAIVDRIKEDGGVTSRLVLRGATQIELLDEETGESESAWADCYVDTIESDVTLVPFDAEYIGKWLETYYPEEKKRIDDVVAGGVPLDQMVRQLADTIQTGNVTSANDELASYLGEYLDSKMPYDRVWPYYCVLDGEVAKWNRHTNVNEVEMRQGHDLTPLQISGMKYHYDEVAGGLVPQANARQLGDGLNQEEVIYIPFDTFAMMISSHEDFLNRYKNTAK